MRERLTGPGGQLSVRCVIVRAFMSCMLVLAIHLCWLIAMSPSDNMTLFCLRDGTEDHLFRASMKKKTDRSSGVS